MAGASQRGPPEQRPGEGALLGPVTRGRGDPRYSWPGAPGLLTQEGGWSHGELCGFYFILFYFIYLFIFLTFIYF